MIKTIWVAKEEEALKKLGSSTLRPPLPYIHSNFSTFSQVSGYERPKNRDIIIEMAEDIKKALLKEVIEQRDFFFEIENLVVKQQIKKAEEEGISVAFWDRGSMLQEFNRFHKLASSGKFDKDGKIIEEGMRDNPVQFLVSFKKEALKVKDVVQEMKKVLDSFRITSGEKELFGALEKKKKLTPRQKARFEILKDRHKAVENKRALNSGKLIKEYNKEIEQVVSKHNVAIERFQKEIAGLIRFLLGWRGFWKEGVSEKDREKFYKEYNKQTTQAWEIVDDAISEITKRQKTNASSKVEKSFSDLTDDLYKKIVSMEEDKFFNTFSRGGRNSVEYINETIKASNIHSAFGFLFEEALVEVMIRVASSNSALSMLFDAKTIGGVGQFSWIRSVSTMDIQHMSLEYDAEVGEKASQKPTSLQKIIIGSSVKLKDETDIFLGSSTSEPYWRRVEEIAGKEKMGEYQYIRKNLIALDIFLPIRLFNQLEVFKEVEKLFYSMVLLPSLLVGFVEKVEEQGKRYRMVTKEEGTEDKLFLTAFLIDRNGVYSTTDILDSILKLFDNDVEKIMRDSADYFSISAKTANFKSVGKELKSKMTELHSLKKIVSKTVTDLEYTNFISYSEISSLIEDIWSGISETSLGKNPIKSFGISNTNFKKLIK